MTNLIIPTLPGALQWHIPPLEWSYEPDKGLSILAGARTDWFADPAGGPAQDNAPCALVSAPDDHFLLSARVAVAFAATFDAGVLQVRVTDELWAKLCFEFSPQGHPMIVSVVTRGRSDDCNSVEVDRAAIYLRVARTPRTLAFHYSYDGHFWHLVRYFSLGTVLSPQVGFSAQSPTGEKCTAVFSEISYRAGTLNDNRSGE